MKIYMKKEQIPCEEMDTFYSNQSQESKSDFVTIVISVVL